MSHFDCPSFVLGMLIMGAVFVLWGFLIEHLTRREQ